MIRCLKPIGPSKYRDGNVYGGKVMTGILMTQVSTPIIGQAAWLLGKIMDGIYRVMDLIGIHNLGVCIILLTIVIYTFTDAAHHQATEIFQDVRCNEP